MALRVLRAGLQYSDKGYARRAEMEQIFDESPWDSVTTATFLARGYIEEIAELAMDEPVVEVVEESEPDLESLTKTELVELAKERGVSSTGTKATILARLTSEEE